MTPEQYAEKAVPRVAVGVVYAAPGSLIQAQLDRANAGRAAEVQRVAKLFQQAMAEPYDELDRCPNMLKTQYGYERRGRTGCHVGPCCYARGD